jgi:hypothetical protein
VRFAGHTAAACQFGAADLAAREDRPPPRCDEPEDDIHYRLSISNAQETKIHFSRRRSGPRRSWVARHARERVSQRSTLSATSVRAMVDEGRCVSLGEALPNRRCCLIYSKADDRCFVVVQDIGNWAVVTVLPLWMWKNGDLSESSPQADEARRLALEPRSRQPRRQNFGHQSRQLTGLFRRRR